MIENNDLEERHVIPRWLSISGAIESGMLARPGVSKMSISRQKFQTENEAAVRSQFEEYKKLWQRERDNVEAEELVSAAVFSDQYDDVLREAAMQVAASTESSPALRSIATRIQNADRSVVGRYSVSEDLRSEIKRRKISIQLNPRDALLLAETALLYANLGQLKKSESLLRQALAISPHSRYVVRSAARFFCHSERPEEALWLIRRTPRHLTDPWLRAAELAVSSLTEAGVSGWRRSKALSEDESLSVLDRSELASELATLELHAGSRKSAIRKLQLAASDPSENAVAQIEFLTRKSDLLNREEISPDVTKSMEARAYRSYMHGDLLDALAACEEWQTLEPFSTRPAIFGSFLSTSRLTDLSRGLRIARSALVGNPRNAALLNNLAVLSAYSGDLEAARRYSSRSRICEDDKNSVANKATEGLIYFREGKIEMAISTYDEAVELATKEKRLDLMLRAYAFFAREMCFIDPSLKGGFKAEFDSIEAMLRKRGFPIPKDVQAIREEFKTSGVEPSEGKLQLIGFRNELLESVLDGGAKFED